MLQGHFIGCIARANDARAINVPEGCKRINYGDKQGDRQQSGRRIMFCLCGVTSKKIRDATWKGHRKGSARAGKVSRPPPRDSVGLPLDYFQISPLDWLASTDKAG